MKKLLLTLCLLLITLPAYAVDVELTASWNANPEADLAGYYIEIGETSGNYDAPIDVGNVTSYDFTVDVPEGTEKTIYAVVSAYDTSGNVSEKSDEANKRIDKQPPGKPTGTVIEIKLTVSVTSDGNVTVAME